MSSTIKTMGVAAPRRTRKKDSASGFWTRLGVLVEIIVLLAGIFMLFSYRVSLGERVTATARQTAKVQKQIHELDREIEALKLKKETYSEWPYIKERIEYFQLGLRPAAPQQRRALVIRTNRRTAPAGKAKTTARR